MIDVEYQVKEIEKHIETIETLYSRPMCLLAVIDARLRLIELFKGKKIGLDEELTKLVTDR